MKGCISSDKKGQCYRCGRTCQTEKHHIFAGPNRKLSEKYGLTVHLCHACHNEPPAGAHFSKETADRAAGVRGRTVEGRRHMGRGPRGVREDLREELFVKEYKMARRSKFEGWTRPADELGGLIDWKAVPGWFFEAFPAALLLRFLAMRLPPQK